MTVTNDNAYPRSAIGQRFGRLVVLDFMQLHSGEQNVWHALCRCDCGTEKWINWYNVNSGKQVSCGCYRLERSHATQRARREARREEIMAVVDAHPEWTLQEIGDEFGYSRERIRQIIKRERGAAFAQKRAVARRELGKNLMDELEHLRAIVAAKEE